MDARNMLFNKALEMLTEKGMALHIAADLVKGVMRKSKANMKAGHASGGQDKYTPAVKLINDLCEGKVILVLSLCDSRETFGCLKANIPESV